MRINLTKLALVGAIALFSPGLFAKLCYDKYCEQQASKKPSKKGKHR